LLGYIYDDVNIEEIRSSNFGFLFIWGDQLSSKQSFRPNQWKSLDIFYERKFLICGIIVCVYVRKGMEDTSSSHGRRCLLLDLPSSPY
jgi:hypothetical protein